MYWRNILETQQLWAEACLGLGGLKYFCLWNSYLIKADKLFTEIARKNTVRALRKDKWCNRIVVMKLLETEVNWSVSDFLLYILHIYCSLLDF